MHYKLECILNCFSLNINIICVYTHPCVLFLYMKDWVYFVEFDWNDWYLPFCRSFLLLFFSLFFSVFPFALNFSGLYIACTLSVLFIIELEVGASWYMCIFWFGYFWIVIGVFKLRLILMFKLFCSSHSSFFCISTFLLFYSLFLMLCQRVINSLVALFFLPCVLFCLWGKSNHSRFILCVQISHFPA